MLSNDNRGRDGVRILLVYQVLISIPHTQESRRIAEGVDNEEDAYFDNRRSDCGSRWRRFGQAFGLVGFRVLGHERMVFDLQ